MAKLVLNGEGSTIEPGDSLKDRCEEGGVPFCCEEGVCGTCMIEIEAGMEHLDPLTEEEVDFLGEGSCERLACQCRVQKSASPEAEVKVRG